MEDEKPNPLIKLIEEYEKTLSYRQGTSIDERVRHILKEYRQIADNAIYQAKNFAEDVKTQFKALEIITEGLTSGEMNHGQKRVIANHIIGMLRRMVDRLDSLSYEYNTNILERYNFFRSYTPERRLHEAHADLTRAHDRLNAWVENIKKKHPEIMNEPENEIPF